MMSRRAFLALPALSLTGCAWLEQNKDSILDAGKAGAIVLTADQLAIELVDYIAGDDKAIAGLLQADGPVDFGLRVADFMKGNLDLPVVQVVKQYPQYLDEFKRKMIMGRAVVLEYNARTKNPIPINIQVMWQNGVDAMDLFDKARDLHDETFKLSSIYRTIEPYVKLGLMLKGVPVSL